MRSNYHDFWRLILVIIHPCLLRCLEMQKSKGSRATAKSEEGRSLKKSKKAAPSSCPFLADSQLVQNVRDISLLEIHDIESLGQMGKEWKACPYYAARNAIADAQVSGKLKELSQICSSDYVVSLRFQMVAVPYQMLLQRSTRQACGLKLQNSVVIIGIRYVNITDVWKHLTF